MTLMNTVQRKSYEKMFCMNGIHMWPAFNAATKDRDQEATEM